MLPSCFPDPRSIASSQKYWFLGIVLATIGYGVNATLFILCVKLLRHRISSGRVGVVGDRTRYRWDIFSICYTTLLFILATVNIVLAVILGERAFVQSWVSPVGPSIYLFDNVFAHVKIFWPAYLAHASSNFLAAGLLAWRCLVLYRASLGDLLVYSRIPMWVVVMTLPFCLLGASLSTGIIFVIDATAPWKLPPVLDRRPWIIIWGTVSITLTLILTGLIVLRLLAYKWATRGILRERQLIPYGCLMTIFVESAGILSLFYVFLIVVFSRKSPMVVMVLFPLAQVQVLSSLHIMHRVTSGKDQSTEDANRTLPMPTFADVSNEST